jgi:D-serine deaminase-like pyridoxal phosphate-dependent protein
MTYPAAGKAEQTEQWLLTARNLLTENGIQCETISSGGTPDMWRSPTQSVVTEYRPGTYIYFDRYQVAKGAATLNDCALTVLSTIVSHPTADRAIIDAGSKSLSSDTLGLADFGELAGKPEARVTGLSEEHGTLKGDLAGLKIGDKVRVIPDHVCVVSNLFDEVHLISGDDVIDILPVAARGKLK